MAIEAALVESRSQAALGQELKALVVLNELPDASADDLAALKSVHGKLRLDTPTYGRATELLGEFDASTTLPLSGDSFEPAGPARRILTES